MAKFVDSDDWRTRCKCVHEAIAEVRRRELFVDVRFMVGQPSSARYFYAHRVIMACGSPVFEAMLFGQLAEKGEPISLPEDDPQAFDIMLQHLYGECIAFPSIVVACKSYSIADKYLIPELRSKSTDFIVATAMDDENFWGLTEGGLLNNECVQEKFRRHIELNAHRLVGSREFLHVPGHVVTTFLRMETVHVSEFALLTSVTNWCLQNLEHERRDQLFKPYLKHIRFSLLTPKEFCLFIEDFPTVLDAPTSLEILKHLNDPSKYHLPAWCSVSSAVRKPAKTELLPSRPQVVPSGSTRTVRFGRPSHH